MMGAGKSTVAKAWVKALPDYTLIDIDTEIENLMGMSISQIFDRLGENEFRRIESAVINDIEPNESLIISTGGGAFELNSEQLLKLGDVFYLKANPQIIYERIKHETHRPLLKCENPIEKIKEILAKRNKNYELAHFCIDTESKTPDNIVNDIRGLYGI